MRPYRVMREYRYLYVGYNLELAMEIFKYVTEAETAAYMGDLHQVQAEPLIAALREDGSLVATLYNVPVEAFTARYPQH